MRNPENLLPDDPNQAVILLTDDDVMVLNIVRVTLERDGYFVLTAEDGDEALYLSRQFSGNIHLLLTDVCMPKMSGIQLAKLLALERRGICILLMSGSFEEENPGFPVLHKPFGTAKLREAVRKLLPACQNTQK